MKDMEKNVFYKVETEEELDLLSEGITEKEGGAKGSIIVAGLSGETLPTYVYRVANNFGVGYGGVDEDGVKGMLLDNEDSVVKPVSELFEVEIKTEDKDKTEKSVCITIDGVAPEDVVVAIDNEVYNLIHENLEEELQNPNGNNNDEDNETEHTEDNLYVFARKQPVLLGTGIEVLVKNNPADRFQLGDAKLLLRDLDSYRLEFGIQFVFDEDSAEEVTNRGGDNGFDILTLTELREELNI